VANPFSWVVYCIARRLFAGAHVHVRLLGQRPDETLPARVVEHVLALEVRIGPLILRSPLRIASAFQLERCKLASPLMFEATKSSWVSIKARQ
jgi:hypothetical protein